MMYVRYSVPGTCEILNKCQLKLRRTEDVGAIMNKLTGNTIKI